MEINNQIGNESKIGPMQKQLGSMATSFLNEINSKIERFAQRSTHNVFFYEDEDEKDGFGIVQGNGNTTVDPNMTLDEFCEVVEEYQGDGEVINSEWEQNSSDKDD